MTANAQHDLEIGYDDEDQPTSKYVSIFEWHIGHNTHWDLLTSLLWIAFRSDRQTAGAYLAFVRQLAKGVQLRINFQCDPAKCIADILPLFPKSVQIIEDDPGFALHEALTQGAVTAIGRFKGAQCSGPISANDWINRWFDFGVDGQNLGRAGPRRDRKTRYDKNDKFVASPELALSIPYEEIIRQKIVEKHGACDLNNSYVKRAAAKLKDELEAKIGTDISELTFMRSEIIAAFPVGETPQQIAAWKAKPTDTKEVVCDWHVRPGEQQQMWSQRDEVLREATNRWRQSGERSSNKSGSRMLAQMASECGLAWSPQTLETVMRQNGVNFSEVLRR